VQVEIAVLEQIHDLLATHSTNIGQGDRFEHKRRPGNRAFENISDVQVEPACQGVEDIQSLKANIGV
jgi:hypothetical protein